MFDYTVGYIDSEKKVTDILEKYERMERSSLLELAIWKARICDGVIFRSVNEMQEYKILDEEFDSSAYSKKMRVINGSDVTIPRVLEFL